MTRFGIDALTAIRLARDRATVDAAHSLVAPTLLRSQALAILYADVRAGRMPVDEAHAILDRATTMRIRLLGDRVSRATAWKVAEQLDWSHTANAEYVAVAQLQADVFVTLDDELARAVADIVTVAPYGALLRDA